MRAVAPVVAEADRVKGAVTNPVVRISSILDTNYPLRDPPVLNGRPLCREAVQAGDRRAAGDPQVPEEHGPAHPQTAVFTRRE